MTTPADDSDDDGEQPLFDSIEEAAVALGLDQLTQDRVAWAMVITGAPLDDLEDDELHNATNRLTPPRARRGMRI